MTASEIARLRALCKDDSHAVVAAAALGDALDEIERLRGCLGRAICVWCGFETSGDDKAEKIPWKAVEAENDLLREEESRLREMIAGLGLDPDAGVPK